MYFNLQGHIGTLTVSHGSPVEMQDTDTLNANLLRSAYFLDLLTHVNRERTSVRVVHPKGAGAFGYFKVTHDITKYCKAKLFSKIGKKTKIAARFSTSNQEKGSIDVAREPRGYAVKFYTEDGNWDIAGFNTPIFSYKDPQYFFGFVHSQMKNPVTNVRDNNAFWDFFLNRPESIHFMLLIFHDLGIPDGHRYMSGFSIHTYELVNRKGESNFARLHFVTDQGLKYLTDEEASEISSKDPDYATRDLYNSIANGSYPSWTLYFELITLEQVRKAKFDPFDVTALWPKDRYPLIPVGRLVLNQNPKNYFADVEQLAFNPANLIPGVPGPPDNVFQGRAFSYRDAQNYRLGINHNKIHVNCPLYARTFNRDGSPPVLDNEGGAPTFYPNHFNGPVPYIDVNKRNPYVAYHNATVDLGQASQFYEDLNDDEKDRLVYNIARKLVVAAPSVKKRTVRFFKNLNADLGQKISLALLNIQ